MNLFQGSTSFTLALSTVLATEPPSKNEVIEKISTLQQMSDAIDDVTTTIESISTRKISKTSCSDFIELVTQFNSIASQISKIDELLSLASTISSASIDSCSDAELSDLASLKTSLNL